MATSAPSQHTPEANAPTGTPDTSGADFVDPGPGHNLPRDISSFIAARIELASIEAKEAAEYASRKTLYGIVMAVCGFFAWSLLLAALTGILAPLADNILAGKIDNLPGWAAVLFLMAIIHALGALIFLGQLKKKPATPLFDLSKKEIEHDKQWLTKNK